jgi:hypothetical protein
MIVTFKSLPFSNSSWILSPRSPSGTYGEREHISDEYRNLEKDGSETYLDVVFRVTIRVHQIEETIIDVNELVFRAPDMRHLHVVGGGGNIFHFFGGKDLQI